MKIYHMIIQKGEDESTRKEYLSKHQGSAPAGWKCVGVCGYHEEAKRSPLHPCVGCVYYATCGSTTRTMPCDGRKTKTELKKEEQ